MLEIPIVDTKADPHQTAPSARRHLTRSRFFPDSELLRAQFGWRVAITRARGTRVLREETEPGTYHFFSAPAGHVFTQDVTMSLLAHLRSFGETALGVSHASSPEVHAYSAGCWRCPHPDPTPADWRYVYLLGARGGGPARISLFPNHALCPPSSGVAVSRIDSYSLDDNTLLVFGSGLAYSIERVNHKAGDLASAMVLFTGYLW